jgi:antitoxin ParD1/3/4
MRIELTAEDEQLVQKRLQTGAFATIEEVIHDALAAQDAESAWLQENNDLINEKIARGLAQLDRGEGVGGEVAQKRLQRRQSDWLRKQSK